jgi:hypothetical protein
MRYELYRHSDAVDHRERCLPVGEHRGFASVPPVVIAIDDP